MTDAELAHVESELGIRVPPDYRQLALSRGDELSSLTHVLGGTTYPFFLDTLYLEPEEVVSVNKSQRASDAAATYACPGWWREYFIFGSNGSGDYYCLKLDGGQEVWFLSCEAGEVTPCCDSLAEYVEQELDRYREATRERAVVYQGTDGQDDSVGKAWLRAETPYPMFNKLARTASPRKLRLFGIECCHRIWELITDSEARRAVLLAERIVEEQASWNEAKALFEQLKTLYLVLCEQKERDKATEVRLWCVGAARNLLQEDQAYLQAAPVRAGDADLLRVWYSASAAVGHHFATDLRHG